VLKIHLELNPKNHTKDAKKKNLLDMNSRNYVESSFDVDENIVRTSVQNDVNMSILHHQEEKDMTKLVHINIQVKKTKIDTLFDSCS
jgi:Mg2+/Co2+ transporter CorC